MKNNIQTTRPYVSIIKLKILSCLVLTTQQYNGDFFSTRDSIVVGLKSLFAYLQNPDDHASDSLEPS